MPRTSLGKVRREALVKLLGNGSGPVDGEVPPV